MNERTKSGSACFLIVKDIAPNPCGDMYVQTLISKLRLFINKLIVMYSNKYYLQAILRRYSLDSLVTAQTVVIIDGASNFY